jgi:hypothetical protein
MTNHETPGILRRTWLALGDALKRGILGKSAQAYMQQFTGSDEYWDRVIAAQRGWPKEPAPQPGFDPGEMNHPKTLGNTDKKGRKQARESRTGTLRDA